MPDDNAQRFAEIQKFQDRLSDWQVSPNGIWFCGAAVRQLSGQYSLLAGKIEFVVPGSIKLPIPQGVLVSKALLRNVWI